MSQTNIAVLVSGHGRGSNMQAIIDACSCGAVNANVSVIIGTKEDSPAMNRARLQGINTAAINPKAFPDNDSYGMQLLDVMNKHNITLICLAGYMRILPSVVIKKYRWAVMNIHPSLIPLFCGQGMFGENVHKAALEYGVKVSGCTVHFVDESYDTGPIIIQKVVPVKCCDTIETLAARILEQEHIAYPEAISLFVQNRLKVEDRCVHILPSQDCN